ncbi:MAG: DNA integrity scanning protein DisA nucleotide-binding domain protein [Spirochaetaceae bacterium]|nr:DNA integrity scanning protein DisA nucleotide-binding domain protein [Spirochaetaceae bacterium]MCF7949984.1 DNA integrity scanning protein DisA nucleotide-binding domain protein [Spirochaetia bacterium]MCF7951085.1 DNA integrity scanning protein DisA nucleotide-binding domain protein [Spirochaetaceae bacterium]
MFLPHIKRKKLEQGISAVTHAMAIALSESTRKISVYYGGKRLVVM